MRFGSVCSGIEAASVAWEPLGWSAAWFAEIEAFPSAVLAHHWPHVMNVGDMTNIAYLIKSGILEAPDVLVGGTPCQAFSVAGSRKSLDDDRGQLSLEYCKILDAIDEANNEKCIAVWENVPGVLSTKDNAFGCFLGELSGSEQELFPTGGKWSNSGYIIGPKRQVAWRVLDAQFFGVAQRRRRVFVVASARNGFNPSEVLFEFESVRRDSPPCRKTWKETTGSASKCFASSGFRMQGLGRYVEDTIHGTLKHRDFKESSGLVVHGTQDPIVSDGVSFPLGRNSGQENVVCFTQNTRDEVRIIGGDGAISGALCANSGAKQTNYLAFGIQGNMIGRSDTAGPQGSGVSNDISFTLTKGDRHAVAPHAGLVRRFTPIEYERLQGFPDNHTLVPYRNKPAEKCPDGPRYAACGNSMAVPVMKWIGSRIDNFVTKK